MTLQVFDKKKGNGRLEGRGFLPSGLLNLCHTFSLTTFFYSLNEEGHRGEDVVGRSVDKTHPRSLFVTGSLFGNKVWHYI
jgi:hypothetical protein